MNYKVDCEIQCIAVPGHVDHAGQMAQVPFFIDRDIFCKYREVAVAGLGVLDASLFTHDDETVR